MPKPQSTDTQVIPDPVLEKRRRRQFTADYKLRIIALADACKHGELNGLLRKEKLYSNQLSDWRREFAQWERRMNTVLAQRTAVPRLLATGPHEVWTWDITKLPLASQLMDEAAARDAIEPGCTLCAQAGTFCPWTAQGSNAT